MENHTEKNMEAELEATVHSIITKPRTPYTVYRDYMTQAGNEVEATSAGALPVGRCSCAEASASGPLLWLL